MANIDEFTTGDVTDCFFKMIDAIILAAAATGSGAHGQGGSYMHRVHAKARKAIRCLAVDCRVRTDDPSFRDSLKMRFGR